MSTPPLIARLTAAGPVLTDGAWGTELQARGLEPGEVADVWNLSHPELVEDVGRAYVDAGSRVILTNTFRANAISLGPHLERGSIAEVNRAGAEISRRAAAGRAHVFGSIGPSGKMLLAGQVSESELAATFAEQAAALASAGVEALVVETMADLREASIAVAAAAATGLPVVACMVYDSGKNCDRTMMGVAPEQAAVELARAGAQAIGANCGVGVAESIPICEALAAAGDLPVWIKPNAGLPDLVDGKVVYRMDAETFASHLPALVAAGARFIGGCCGTTPGFVAALRRRLESRS